MVKPTKEQIDKMNYKKPITSFKDVKKSLAAEGKPIYMDGSDVMPTPNVDAIDSKGNFAPGAKRNTL
tara:strand:+ start:162 stop:362 length:201 start_codon:yes stop_codon:yes gene_type:complete